MKRGLVIVAVLAVLLIGVGGCLVGNYNRLVTAKESVAQRWAQVDNQLQRRNDLIGNLVETVKGTATQEQEVFGAIADARARMAGARTRDAATLPAHDDRSAGRPRPTRRPHRDHGSSAFLGDGPGRPWRAHHSGRSRRGDRPPHRPPHPRLRAPRTHRHARLPGCPRPSGPRRPHDAALRPARVTRAGRGPGDDRRSRPQSSRRFVDPWRRAPHPPPGSRPQKQSRRKTPRQSPDKSRGP